MDMRRRAVVLFLSWALFGCTAGGQEPRARGTRGWSGRVRVYGSLREILHQGRTGATVTLAELLPDSDLYALGALAGLAGEITIIGGRAYLSYAEDARRTRTEVTSRSDAAAALLVAARVTLWRKVVTRNTIRFEDLDDAIGRLAVSVGLDPEHRFPFLLEGTFVDLRWHVIDGRRLAGRRSSHAGHLAASIRGHRERASAVLLGFYSLTDQGTFTHRGSHIHLHCVLAREPAAGHVDHVTLPPGTIVEFPREPAGAGP